MSVIIASPAGGIALKTSRRRLLAGIFLCLAGLGIGIWTLASGDYPLTFYEILDVVRGGGDETARMVVMEWRLPRFLAALVAGAMLGLAGALFQSVFRNPLASPDVMGFDAGAHFGAVVAMLVFGGGFFLVAGGALSGGAVAALAVYLFVARGLSGFRLIVVGIGIGQLFFAASQWLLLQAGEEAAVAVASWGLGSLNDMDKSRLAYLGISAVLLVPPGLLLARSLRQLELGDAIARGTGLDPGRTRLSAILVGLALSALVTALVGPIGFIALVAPQIARRLTADGDVALVHAALAGSILLGASDLLAQKIPSGMPLPVGVVTLVLGGLWFFWLLLRSGRVGTS
ncbi:iron chelate uptake ABC transporter family permease subunit [Shinella daejeonensis]|uniref:FecCD family ABC transporter permease n=1 Tax=Shinella daejeonensis TaxID=659017 RepID=UPI0020C75772|nr:iron chelate uptake ABC transporter family permease subunit [Shinella daejeonensis]MCP8896215.1 iron chelate uptake ABC transporter family permease subunit [Shinella daejeonensis]